MRKESCGLSFQVNLLKDTKGTSMESLLLQQKMLRKCHSEEKWFGKVKKSGFVELTK